jgi:CRISPR/Cas system-associated exonuclease Cas4 (RecB family)
MTAAVVDTTLGELLSPSQVNTFLSCPAKWYFRYALGLVEPPTGTLALGTAPRKVIASALLRDEKFKA